jgi:hypothetical protein
MCRRCGEVYARFAGCRGCWRCCCHASAAAGFAGVSCCSGKGGRSRRAPRRLPVVAEEAWQMVQHVRGMLKHTSMA